MSPLPTGLRAVDPYLKPIQPKPPAYLGVDPGVHGGMALINVIGEVELVQLANMTEEAVIDWLERKHHYSGYRLQAYLEVQHPRPTFFKGRSSILKSTCILYGDYQRLWGVLSTLHIPTRGVLPKEWQAGVGAGTKDGRTDGQWKAHLRHLAQSFFPGNRVVNAVADAMLIASYGKQLSEKNGSSSGPA